MIRPNFIKGDKVCILRSAFLGDWITIIPFINYLVEICEISINDIYFIILNKEASNPAAIIFGKDSIFSKNTFSLNSSSLKKLLSSTLAVRRKLPKSINKLVLLSFTRDSKVSINKKKLISYLLFGNKVAKFGFDNLLMKNLSESQYLSYFDKLGIILNNSRINLKTFLDESIHEKKTSSAKKKIVIYANSKLVMKIWPIQKYIELVRLLNKTYIANFYLIGGKEDYDYNEEINKKLIQEGISIENLAGKITIKDTITFLKQTDLLVSNDGAPIHFAGLVNTPTVGIYTFKEPVGAWEPLINDYFETIRTDVGCKLCYKEFCSNPVCITSIGCIDVYNLCKQLLDNNKQFEIRKANVIIPQKKINYLTSYVN